MALHVSTCVCAKHADRRELLKYIKDEQEGDSKQDNSK